MAAKPTYIKVRRGNGSVYKFHNFSTYTFGRDWLAKSHVNDNSPKYLKSTTFGLVVDNADANKASMPINKVSLCIRNCSEDILESFTDTIGDYLGAEDVTHSEQQDDYGVADVFIFNTGSYTFPLDFIRGLLSHIEDAIGDLYIVETKKNMPKSNLPSIMVVREDVIVRNKNIKGKKFKVLLMTKDKKGGALVLADFGEDIGGSCLDGELPYHSCIFISMDKVEELPKSKAASTKK